MEPLSEKKIDVLKFVHNSQRAEFQGHRNSIFNATTWWTTILIAVMGAIIVFPPQFDRARPAAAAAVLGLIALFLLFVTLISILVVVFICRQRSYAAEALRIMIDIETQLGLFEDHVYLPGKSVLPSYFADPPQARGRPSKSDWIQIGIIVVLTLLVWMSFVIWGCTRLLGL